MLHILLAAREILKGGTSRLCVADIKRFGEFLCTQGVLPTYPCHMCVGRSNRRGFMGILLCFECSCK